MKKIISLALFASLLISCASAGNYIDFKIKYNAAAKLFAAPEISDYVKDGNIYGFKISDGFIVMAQENGGGEVTGVVVCYASEDDLTDFIYASISAMTAYAKINYKAYGALLYQIARIRSGETNDAFLLDDFSAMTVKATDKYPFMFVYTLPVF